MSFGNGKMPEEVDQEVTNHLRKIVEETATYKALQKYRPLVRRLSLEEYAGLRAAVEEDRIRRLADVYVKYPWMLAEPMAPEE